MRYGYMMAILKKRFLYIICFGQIKVFILANTTYYVPLWERAKFIKWFDRAFVGEKYFYKDKPKNFGELPASLQSITFTRALLDYSKKHWSFFKV